VSNTFLIPVIVGMVIAIIAVIAMNVDQSPPMEADVLDQEISPDEELSPEIQERYDALEEINLDDEYSPKEREWITSGPFQIDRSEYVLGEKIFLIIGGIQQQEKGQITFLRPLNDTHSSVYQNIPFDGTQKRAFNYYLQPQLSAVNGYCTVDDFIGDWRVVFRGTDYPNLEFKITDEILPGDEESYSPVC
jgi:hypothetical protein